MSMEKETFEAYCREMYQENCVERDAYGEPILSYEEYIAKNRKFLRDNFDPVQYNTCIDNEKGI